ncbi:MAG: hypothetical protein ACE5QW_06190 [Thermoplasmata archaeon]
MEKNEAILAVAVNIPVLLIRFSFQLLRFESKRKSAVRIFRKELRSQEIRKEHTDLLTRKYGSAGSLRNLIKSFPGGSIFDFARRD